MVDSITSSGNQFIYKAVQKKASENTTKGGTAGGNSHSPASTISHSRRASGIDGNILFGTGIQVSIDGKAWTDNKAKWDHFTSNSALVSPAIVKSLIKTGARNEDTEMALQAMLYISSLAAKDYSNKRDGFGAVLRMPFKNTSPAIRLPESLGVTEDGAIISRNSKLDPAAAGFLDALAVKNTGILNSLKKTTEDAILYASGEQFKYLENALGLVETVLDDVSRLTPSEIYKRNTIQKANDRANNYNQPNQTKRKSLDLQI